MTRRLPPRNKLGQFMKVKHKKSKRRNPTSGLLRHLVREGARSKSPDLTGGAIGRKWAKQNDPRQYARIRRAARLEARRGIIRDESLF